MSDVIFVCTSNTCRSPMAMGFAQKMYPDFKFASRSISTEYEPENSSANKNAKNVMANVYNIDLSSHRSKLLSSSDVDSVKYLICVSERHAAFIRQSFTVKCKGKVITFDKDIADPWNQELDVYDKCAKELQSAVSKVLGSILK